MNFFSKLKNLDATPRPKKEKKDYEDQDFDILTEKQPNSQ
jgi:hypothetical protein